MKNKFFILLSIFILSNFTVGCSNNDSTSNISHKYEIEDTVEEIIEEPITTDTPQMIPKEPSPEISTNETNEIIVYTTNTGSKYHNDGCQYLSKSKIPINLSDAINSGSTPCSVCNPPQSNTIQEVSPVVEEPVLETPVSEPIEVIVYTTKTGSKYHKDGCKYLSKSKIPISLSDAKNSGLTPCSVCNPPQ